jgi:hypothetical protein
MQKWPHVLGSHSRELIDVAVMNKTWQQLRVSLKGIPTTEKLKALDEYLKTSTHPLKHVQVDNYINALKRGGQLSVHCEVQR